MTPQYSRVSGLSRQVGAEPGYGDRGRQLPGHRRSNPFGYGRMLHVCLGEASCREQAYDFWTDGIEGLIDLEASPSTFHRFHGE